MGWRCYHMRRWLGHLMVQLPVSQHTTRPAACAGLPFAIRSKGKLQVHAQLAALLLRSPSYKANTAVPAQHTLPERFALLIFAFKPVAELGSVSDTAMSAVVARVNELAASCCGATLLASLAAALADATLAVVVKVDAVQAGAVSVAAVVAGAVQIRLLRGVVLLHLRLFAEPAPCADNPATTRARARATRCCAASTRRTTRSR